MSHAAVIVALDGPSGAGSWLEDQIQFQMEPFDENGEWFRDGSRWDWYQVGGRYSGKFLGADVARKGDLQLSDLIQFKKKKAEDCYLAAQEESKKHDPTWCSFVYGFNPAEISLDAYVEENTQSPLTAYAFLRNRHWHEGERMGWFGVTAKTECEIANPGLSVEEAIRRCVTKDEKMGARLVTWNEPWEIWQKMFYKRFIEPLPEETILACVDYHI